MPERHCPSRERVVAVRAGSPPPSGMTAARAVPARRRPVVAVLVTHWVSKTEEGWITRQVAGALACGAEVRVITPDGSAPRTSVDSVFTVHRLGAGVDRAAEL